MSPCDIFLSLLALFYNRVELHKLQNRCDAAQERCEEKIEQRDTQQRGLQASLFLFFIAPCTSDAGSLQISGLVLQAREA